MYLYNMLNKIYFYNGYQHDYEDKIKKNIAILELKVVFHMYRKVYPVLFAKKEWRTTKTQIWRDISRQIFNRYSLNIQDRYILQFSQIASTFIFMDSSINEQYNVVFYCTFLLSVQNIIL